MNDKATWLWSNILCKIFSSPDIFSHLGNPGKERTHTACNGKCRNRNTHAKKTGIPTPVEKKCTQGTPEGFSRTRIMTTYQIAYTRIHLPLIALPAQGHYPTIITL